MKLLTAFFHTNTDACTVFTINYLLYPHKLDWRNHACKYDELILLDVSGYFDVALTEKTKRNRRWDDAL